MNKPFLLNYLIEVDDRLKNEYDNPISRIDYITFLDWFDSMLSFKKSYEFSFHMSDERIKWGRIKTEDGINWKLKIILDTLALYGIIYRSNYRFGEISYSRSYQYTQDFLDSIKFELAHINEEVNIKIFNTISIENRSDTENSQYKLLMSSRFNIDCDKATKWVFNQYEDQIIDKDKANRYFKMIYSMFYKNIFVIKGELNNRIYSSFNTIKKELRQFCTIDGIYLHSLDLKSSQAYFLAHYLRKKYPDDTNVKTFFDLIVNEDLYLYLKDKLNYSTRDEAKEEFFHFLYKGNMGYVPVQRIIMNEFPSVYNHIMSLNRECKNNKTSLSVLLQKIESSIFIPICERFIDKGCLSVHDSLYFKQEIEGDLRASVEEVLNSLQYTQYKIL